MKFGQTGDLHLDEHSILGGKVWLDEVVARLRTSFEDMVDHNVDFVAVLGDEFSKHFPNQVSEELKDKLLYIYDPCFQARIPIITVGGNHAWNGNITALTVLSKLASYTGLLYDLSTHEGIFEAPGGSKARILGTPYYYEIENKSVSVKDIIHPDCVVADILFFHNTFRGEKYIPLSDHKPADLWFGPEFELPEGCNVNYIGSGHIHCAMVSQTKHGDIYYAGSPLPTNFGESKNNTGYLIISSTDAEMVSFHKIDHTPIVVLNDPNMEMPENAIVQVKVPLDSDKMGVLRQKNGVVKKSIKRDRIVGTITSGNQGKDKADTMKMVLDDDPEAAFREEDVVAVFKEILKNVG